MKVIRVTIRAEVIEVNPDDLLPMPDTEPEGFVVYGREIVNYDPMIPALVAHHLKEAVAEAMEKVGQYFPEDR